MTLEEFAFLALALILCGAILYKWRQIELNMQDEVKDFFEDDR